MQRIIILIIYILFFAPNLWATAQIPDIIIYKGDTLRLNNCPLSSYPHQELINPKILFGGKGCFYTACWRNYVATWEIVDNELFLMEIRNACYPTSLKGVSLTYKKVEKDSIGNEFADLKSIFPDRFHNGKVKADWVTGDFYIPLGKLLHYVHLGFESTYEYEYKLIINNGSVEQVEKLDNRKAHWTAFTAENNPDTLGKFLNSKINWSRLTKLPKDSIVKIKVNFSANENGEIDFVKLKDSIRNDYTSEAIRVVKTVPSWDVRFVHGKHIRDTVFYTIRFVRPIDSQELKQLIAHDKKIATYTTDQKVQIVKNREKISDSIKVFYFKEYRKKDSRDYAISYTFIDYTLNNKYVQKIQSENYSFVNEYVIRDGQQKKLVKHDSNVSKSIAPIWYPLTFYDGNFYNYKDKSRFYCSISDSVLNTPRKYCDTYLIREFTILDKNHFKFELSRFGEKDSLDFHFLDSKQKYALMKFKGRFQLFADQTEIAKFPILTYYFSDWKDINQEFDKIESEIDKLPKDLDLLKDTIRKLIKFDY